MAEKPNILLTKQLKKVVTVNKPQNCITVKDMKFQCIKNPSFCENTGFTIALWLRNRGDNEQYIAYGIRAHKGSGIIDIFLYEGQNTLFIDSEEQASHMCVFCIDLGYVGIALYTFLSVFN